MGIQKSSLRISMAQNSTLLYLTETCLATLPDEENSEYTYVNNLYSQLYTDQELVASLITMYETDRLD